MELEQYPKCGNSNCLEYPGIDGICCRILTRERIEAQSVQRDFTWLLEVKSTAEMQENPQLLRNVLHYDPLTEAGRRIDRLVSQLLVDEIS